MHPLTIYAKGYLELLRHIVDEGYKRECHYQRERSQLCTHSGSELRRQEIQVPRKRTEHRNSDIGVIKEQVIERLFS